MFVSGLGEQCRGAGCFPGASTPTPLLQSHPLRITQALGWGTWKVPGLGCGGLHAFVRCWGLMRACLHTELFLN